ncbi:hypothetical protein JHK84_050917 [Glycine max]|nr:hypothetical protein JHK84_050917 [Glycine max]
MRSNEEEVSHLFFNCDRILPLWWESLTWLNIEAVFPKSPRYNFLQHCHISRVLSFSDGKYGGLP